MISPPSPETCGVFELRQYALKPGRRDDLIDLFDREFVEGQEREGMCILGTFRDLERDDRFVWIRGFRDMEERAHALTSFYSGPVWRAHSAEANDTMVDVSDVLLLRPLGPVTVPPPRDDAPTMIAAIAPAPADDAQPPAAEPPPPVAGGGPWRARFGTLKAENTYPALPIREDADVIVTLAVGGESEPASERLHLRPTRRTRARWSWG
jgi:hypothetical protein